MHRPWPSALVASKAGADVALFLLLCCSCLGYRRSPSCRFWGGQQSYPFRIALYWQRLSLLRMLEYVDCKPFAVHCMWSIGCMIRWAVLLDSVNTMCHDLGSWHICIYNSCKLWTNACYLCVVAFHCKHRFGVVYTWQDMFSFCFLDATKAGWASFLYQICWWVIINLWMDTSLLNPLEKGIVQPKYCEEGAKK